METPPKGDLPSPPDEHTPSAKSVQPNPDAPKPNPDTPQPQPDVPTAPGDAPKPNPDVPQPHAENPPEHEPESSDEGHGGEEHLPKWQTTLRNLPEKVKWAAISLPLLLLLLWWLFAGPASAAAHMKTYVIAIDSTWYPLQLMGRESQMTGFSEALLKSIAQESNLKINLVTNSPTRIFPDLENGRYNGILSSQPTNYFPSGQYLFSRSIYRLGPVLVVKENSKITSLDDLGGRIVGVVGDNLIITQIDDYPSIIFNSYRTASLALSDLEDNTIDGIIINALQGNTLLQGYYSGKFKVVSAPLTKDSIRLVLHKDSQAEDFIDLFDKGLKKLKRDGTYGNLIKAWDLINTDPE